MERGEVRFSSVTNIGQRLKLRMIITLPPRDLSKEIADSGMKA